MRVVCVHVPRFAVDVERQRRNDLATRLVLVGEATVFDCSLGAETSGVRHGMRMSEAIGLCHRAVVLPRDLPHYRRRFDEVLGFLEEFSPAVESAGLGTAYLSLNGLSVETRPFAETLIADLHRRSGFMASLGVAGAKFAARVAAQTTRPGLAKVVPPGGEAAFVAPLPVDHLPAGDPMRWRLRLLGLESMGDIARLPLGAFQQQFGPEGKRCWELANGIDNEPLVSRIKEETVVRQLRAQHGRVSVGKVVRGRAVVAHTGAACGPSRVRPLSRPRPLRVEVDESDRAVALWLSGRRHAVETMLESLPDGTQVQVAGLVVCRQQPCTAKGFVFLVLEDEFGLVNLVVKPSIHERQRSLVRAEPFVIVHGELQRRDGTVNVIAERFTLLQAENAVAPEAHNFG